GLAHVDRALVVEIVVAHALVALARAEPGGAVEAEGFRIGPSGLERLRQAHELAVGMALPGRLAGIDHGIAHLDRVAAAGEDVAAADADAIWTLPDEGH